MAKKHSDDEFAKKGGQVGWVVRGTLEPPLEAALDKLEVGQISPPVETNFGYFLLQVTKKKDTVTHPFETVKTSIAEKLGEEKYKKDFAEATKGDWEEMLAQGKPLDKELKKYRVEVKKTGPFSIGQGYIPNIGQSDTLMDAVFKLSPKNRIPKNLYYHQNHYYYVKLESVERPKKGDFAKNREAVEKSLGTALQSALMSQWVASLRKNSTIKKVFQFPEQPETMVQ